MILIFFIKKIYKVYYYIIVCYCTLLIIFNGIFSSWSKKKKMEIHHLVSRGKCYNFIENLYLSSKACVRVNGQLS